MTTHTPGPWAVMSRKQWEDGFDFFDGPDNAYTFMADVDEDDARLIAAAPELLEALQTLDSLWSESGVRGVDFEYAIKQARAAIAKATGEIA